MVSCSHLYPFPCIPHPATRGSPSPRSYPRTSASHQIKPESLQGLTSVATGVVQSPSHCSSPRSTRHPPLCCPRGRPSLAHPSFRDLFPKSFCQISSDSGSDRPSLLPVLPTWTFPPPAITGLFVYCLHPHEVPRGWGSIRFPVFQPLLGP